MLLLSKHIWCYSVVKMLKMELTFNVCWTWRQYYKWITQVELGGSLQKPGNWCLTKKSSALNSDAAVQWKKPPNISISVLFKQKLCHFFFVQNILALYWGLTLANTARNIQYLQLMLATNRQLLCLLLILANIKWQKLSTYTLRWCVLWFLKLGDHEDTITSEFHRS